MHGTLFLLPPGDPQDSICHWQWHVQVLLGRNSEEAFFWVLHEQGTTGARAPNLLDPHSLDSWGLVFGPSCEVAFPCMDT